MPAFARRLEPVFGQIKRAAHRDYWRAEPRDEEWLLIEWPEGEAEPTKYWLATVPEDIPLNRFVDLAKLRRRIERD
jgi:SRSO17 transposase